MTLQIYFKQFRLVSEILKCILNLKNIFYINIWPSSVTLSLSWHNGYTSSAHYPLEVNIWAKFKENPSINIRFLEWTKMKWNDRATNTTQRIQYILPPHFFVTGYKIRLCGLRMSSHVRKVTEKWMQLSSEGHLNQRYRNAISRKKIFE